MRISFDKQLYTLTAVKNAICAYKGIAIFNIKTNKDSIELEVKNINKDVQKIFEDEFCNFVLSEMKKIKSL